MRYMGRRTITNASNPMFEKYTGWQYEREWRLLERKGNQLYDYPGDLLSVICGARMTLSEVDRVQKVVATLNSSRTRRVLVKFALMHPSRYSIAIKSRRLDF